MNSDDLFPMDSGYMCDLFSWARVKTGLWEEFKPLETIRSNLATQSCDLFFNPCTATPGFGLCWARTQMFLSSSSAQRVVKFWAVTPERWWILNPTADSFHTLTRSRCTSLAVFLCLLFAWCWCWSHLVRLLMNIFLTVHPAEEATLRRGFMALSSPWFLISDSVHDPDEVLQSRCFFMHVIWFIPPLLKVTLMPLI